MSFWSKNGILGTPSSGSMAAVPATATPVGWVAGAWGGWGGWRGPGEGEVLWLTWNLQPASRVRAPSIIALKAISGRGSGWSDVQGAGLQLE